MMNTLAAYLDLTPEQRGFVLEWLGIEEREMFEIAAEKTPDSDREVFVRSQAEALAAARALLEDVTKLSYEPPKFSVIPDPEAFRHPVDATQIALVRTWVLCPKHERDALVASFRVLFREVTLDQATREVYGKLAAYLEAIAEGLT